MWLMRVVTVAKLIGRNGLLLLFALRHPLTPRNLKIGIVAMLAYLISPIDIVPEFLGFLGLADDAALLMVGIPFLMKRLPEQVRLDAQEKASALLRRFGFGSGPQGSPGETVDAETSTRPRS
ncbi:MAG: YkvA family protein [Burkholderiaceae bacterium]